MHVYKFKLTIEESEDFIREFEVLSSQNFEDFHNAILKSINFDGSELASFYICNDKWFRKSEVTLLDMTEEEQTEQDEPDDIRVQKSNKMKRYVMHKALLKDHIEDPHQRLIYEYDFLNVKTFYLELIRIQPSQSNKDYPNCTVSRGDYPKDPAQMKTLIPEEFEELYEDNYNGEDENEPGFELEEFDDLSMDADEFGNDLLKNKSDI